MSEAEAALTAELAEHNRLQREALKARKAEQLHQATERYVQRARQKDLTHVGVGFLARGAPVVAEALARKIPPEFWTLIEDRRVDVACPCGETPRVAYDGITKCGCERVYVYDGQAVRVANSPTEASA